MNTIIGRTRREVGEVVDILQEANIDYNNFANEMKHSLEEYVIHYTQEIHKITKTMDKVIERLVEVDKELARGRAGL
jgi:uncharacterized protein Yka (UPF0111/DUF47 family)